ncbi:hypothetical protein D3C76_1101630 [compost metagenome]
MKRIPSLDVNGEGLVTRLEGQCAIFSDQGIGRAIESPFKLAGGSQFIDSDIVLPIGGPRLAFHLENRVVLVLGDVDGPFVERVRLGHIFERGNVRGNGRLQLPHP